jgi:hypothetical protein
MEFDALIAGRDAIRYPVILFTWEVEVTTMNAELYDALIAGGTPDDKARKAAEALADGDKKHGELLRAFERLEGKFSTMTWMIGVLIAINAGILARMVTH